jgi:hypothetical protein
MESFANCLRSHGFNVVKLSLKPISSGLIACAVWWHPSLYFWLSTLVKDGHYLAMMAGTQPWLCCQAHSKRQGSGGEVMRRKEQYNTIKTELVQGAWTWACQGALLALIFSKIKQLSSLSLSTDVWPFGSQTPTQIPVWPTIAKACCQRTAGWFLFPF